MRNNNFCLSKQRYNVNVILLVQQARSAPTSYVTRALILIESGSGSHADGSQLAHST